MRSETRRQLETIEIIEALTGRAYAGENATDADRYIADNADAYVAWLNDAVTAPARECVFA